MTALESPGADPTDALSPVPAWGSRREVPNVGKIKFSYGPMDCGKSTLALQIDHNLARQGRQGLLLVSNDRSGPGQITSRIGITREALELDVGTDLRSVVRQAWEQGTHVDYLIVDEAQFLSPAQVEQLGELADEATIDVYCFGIATDFRSRLFPGARRLFELADELQPVQVEVLCWCGLPGRFNARVYGDEVQRTGDTVVVADTADVTEDAQPLHETAGDTHAPGADGATPNPPGAPLTVSPAVAHTSDDDGEVSIAEVNRTTPPSQTDSTTVRYQVLCRRHYRLGDLGPAGSGHGQLRLT
ncbi:MULTISPECIES: thymidine kinase [Prauserella salsuginis group]|uniref:Thymidine kinase n=2 Tax=Prauserella salsuginis group TaxID=2893672 RepID=A0A839XQL9_9PSEU|nr:MULTISPECIES: thymidine kinase [Prauserella salsuginis group]MBB3666112.1 thymidine kinase [Prauserella sediminis]MCR3718176.1 thymidine kinase [Prauserella flava]MCR3732746.1 thymidine kinase [Prauserella salsuginis]